MAASFLVLRHGERCDNANGCPVQADPTLTPSGIRKIRDFVNGKLIPLINRLEQLTKAGDAAPHQGGIDIGGVHEHELPQATQEGVILQLHISPFLRTVETAMAIMSFLEEAQAGGSLPPPGGGSGVPDATLGIMAAAVPIAADGDHKVESSGEQRSGIKVPLDVRFGLDPAWCEVFGPQRVKGSDVLGPPTLRDGPTKLASRLLVLDESASPVTITFSKATVSKSSSLCGPLPQWPESPLQAHQRFTERLALSILATRSTDSPREMVPACHTTLHVFVTHGDALQAIVGWLHPEQTVFECDFLAYALVTFATDSRTWRVAEMSGCSVMVGDGGGLCTRGSAASLGRSWDQVQHAASAPSKTLTMPTAERHDTATASISHEEGVRRANASLQQNDARRGPGLPSYRGPPSRQPGPPCEGQTRDTGRAVMHRRVVVQLCGRVLVGGGIAVIPSIAAVVAHQSVASALALLGSVMSVHLGVSLSVIAFFAPAASHKDDVSAKVPLLPCQTCCCPPTRGRDGQDDRDTATLLHHHHSLVEALCPRDDDEDNGSQAPREAPAAVPTMGHCTAAGGSSRRRWAAWSCGAACLRTLLIVLLHLLVCELAMISVARSTAQLPSEPLAPGRSAGTAWFNVWNDPAIMPWTVVTAIGLLLCDAAVSFKSRRLM